MKYSYFCYLEVVKHLLEQKGIDVNAEDLNGKTAIILAAEKKNRTEIFEMLKNHEGIIYDGQFNAEETKRLSFNLFKNNSANANGSGNNLLNNSSQSLILNTLPRFNIEKTASENGSGFNLFNVSSFFHK